VEEAREEAQKEETGGRKEESALQKEETSFSEMTDAFLLYMRRNAEET